MSRNTVAAQVLVDVIGFDTSLSYLHQVGIDSQDRLVSSAMGALNRKLTCHYLELEANGLKARSESRS